MDEVNENVVTVERQKTYVSPFEKWSYIVGISFFGMLQGMINGYRGDFLTNIIQVNEKNQQIINVVTTIVGFILGFFITYYLENFRGKKGKFRPIAIATFIPYALFSFLVFYTPFDDSNSGIGVTYLIIIWILYTALSTFVGTKNNVALVMTPNEEERNKIISSRNFFRSIMNSAPMVVVLVLGIFYKKGFYSKNVMYVISLAICAVAYVVSNFVALGAIRERIPYLEEKKPSPFKGIMQIIKNKNFIFLTLSNLTRQIYKTGTAMGIFLAAALFGDTSDYLLLGIPTGVGTFVGMVIVRIVMKKKSGIYAFNFFGIYSLVINALAFISGYFFLRDGGTLLLIIFYALLFGVGFQFGASNILPEIFNAEVLNEIELQTGGRRLENSMGFTTSIFTTLATVLTGLLAPMLLLNEKFTGYIQGDGIVQSFRTNIWLLFFYTLFAGIFFCLSIIPFFGYKLTNKCRAEMMVELDKMREERALNSVSYNEDEK